MRKHSKHPVAFAGDYHFQVALLANRHGKLATGMPEDGRLRIGSADAIGRYIVHTKRSFLRGLPITG
jgi:hypothetical protein